MFKGTIRDIISLVVNHPVLRVVVMLNVCSFMLLSVLRVVVMLNACSFMLL